MNTLIDSGNPLPRNPKPQEPELVLTAPCEPKADWREYYHTFEELLNAPPISFLIDGFLEVDGITAIAAPVGQRKTLISLNIARSLLTGEPLFGRFKVVRKPERVIYLCPEMGIQSFSSRVKKLGMLDYSKDGFFLCRTLSKEGKFTLNLLTPEQLTGSVVFLDTAIRFMNGNEKESEDMRFFAESIFALIRGGALSVVMLHHSPKETKGSNELTLENALRGSGELGAFVASCWATRLQDPHEQYKSPSFITNVKQRDFESKPFEATCDDNGLMTATSDPEAEVTLNATKGAKANADGKENEALALIKANMHKMGAPALKQLLKDHDIIRSQAWCGTKKAELKKPGDPGVTHTAANG